MLKNFFSSLLTEGQNKRVFDQSRPSQLSLMIADKISTVIVEQFFKTSKFILEKKLFLSGAEMN
jgi:hypothetical protein